MRLVSLPQDTKSYLLSIGIFSLLYTIYGQHICPVLNSKDFWGVLIPCAAVLVGIFFARNIAIKKLEPLAHDKRLRWSFWADFALFLIGGVVVSAFNRMFFNVPLENCFKVGVSFLALGYYITLDLSLQREHRLAGRIISGEAEFPENGRSMPVTQKFLIFSMLNIIILATVCLLVVYKDLLFAGRVGVSAGLIGGILLEVAFVLIVFGGYICRAIVQYSRNLKLSLETEHKALVEVSNGNLQNRAAITSMDEFGEVAHLTNEMIEKLEASIDNLTKTQNAFVVSMVSLAAKRDNETGMHLHRTQHYVAELAGTLRTYSSYANLISKDCVNLLFQAAPLHDIGKVGIPDAILQKPGPLDDDEFEIMKTHTTIGAAALADAARELDDSRLICLAREIVISHHEKWNGTGYPCGLAGTDIPLSGRLMAVADVYDALRSNRVYKSAMTHGQAVAIIAKDAGKHFDPDIVEAFLKCEKKIEKIAASLKDKAPSDDEANVFDANEKATIGLKAA